MLQLSLRKKIMAGSVAVGVVLAAASGFTYVAFEKVADNFRAFINFSDRAQLQLQLLKSVSELQRQALIYTYEGHESAAEEVRELSSDLLALIETQQAESVETQKMRDHLQSYLRAFEQLKSQRIKQQQLVRFRIREQAEAMERHYLQFMGREIKEVKGGERLQLEQIRSTMLKVEKFAIRYFETLDHSYIAQTKEAVNETITNLETLRRSVADKTHAHRDLDAAHAAASELRLTFLEAIQRTRAYLFLVNVVMAADAAEVLYRSARISDSVHQEMNSLEISMRSLLQQQGFTVIVVVVGALLLIALFTLMVGRAVSQPILKLAETFTALAQGSREAKIPAYAVDDELGQLTRAAEVFRDKNAETEQLLGKATALTAELEQNKEELERSNDELEQFVYTVSHDLKSPLVTSMGFISIIKKLSEQGRLEEAVGRLDRVVKANERMAQLINDLLELSRVGRVELDMQHLDLAELLPRFAGQHTLELEKAGATLEIADAMPMIRANESRILQLFENLLSNALKYGIGSAKPRICIGWKRDNDSGETLISFSDNGPGIAPEFHEKIFGLFYRLDVNVEGTGIGLAVAAKVVKFHGGRIWVESQEGEGATFWLSFPAIEESDNE